MTHEQNLSFSRKLLDTAVVGLNAGFIEGITCYPSEFIKTQLQLDSENARKNNTAKKFTGSIDCLKKTVWVNTAVESNTNPNPTREILKNVSKAKNLKFTPIRLYTGLSPMLLCAVPKICTRFSAYELGSHLIAPSKKSTQLTTSETMIAGFFAGAAEATFVVTPQETIKVKFIHDSNRAKPEYKNLVHGLKNIHAELGWKGIYAGYTATLMKESANCMMRFGLVMGLKEWYRVNFEHSDDSSSEPPLYVTAGFAAFAGIFSVSVNMPVDVIKTRMQGLGSSRYTGVIDCAKCIYADDGVRGFYRGMPPRYTRVIIELVVCFTIFDWLKPKVSKRTDSYCKSVGWE